MTTSESLIISLYWAITTLSVVGYGDLYPINSVEMVLGTIVILGGVVFFSFIMSSIIDIIENYSSGAHSDIASKVELNLWITSMEKYKGSHHVSKNLHE